MKVFFSTLSAILVAAVIIWVVFAINQTHQARLKLEAETRQRTEERKAQSQEAESRKAQLEWIDQVAKDVNFDHGGEKLKARLKEIKEAIDNNRPIPPSPWQTPETANR
jgi:hypothetical protein